MGRFLALAALAALLAGCGADGAPTKPEPKSEEETPQRGGVTVTGTASIGVAGRTIE